jgi:hypothetical protein
MNKREQEEHVLMLAKPLLEKLYGKFSVDQNQMDRPDAAIVVDKPRKCFGIKAKPFTVGIEITTVDKGEDLAYLNDEKYGRDRVIAQTMETLNNGVDSSTPIKSIEVEITDSYIYDGAIRKAEKYQDYLESGTYRQIILLCFSDVISTDTDFFNKHLKDCTNHLLSKAQFPFDVVVFVSLRQGNPVRVYRKSDPLLVPPPPSEYLSSSETITKGPTMLFGRNYNIQEIMSNAPLIAKRQPKSAS